MKSKKSRRKQKYKNFPLFSSLSSLFCVCSPGPLFIAISEKLRESWPLPQNPGSNGFQTAADPRENPEICGKIWAVEPRFSVTILLLVG